MRLEAGGYFYSVFLTRSRLFPGYLDYMGKVVTAEYDAAQNVLRLLEPLDGVRDHEMVQVLVQVITTGAKAKSTWSDLRGSLSKEAGEELSRIVNEMFPPWND